MKRQCSHQVLIIITKWPVCSKMHTENKHHGAGVDVTNFNVLLSFICIIMGASDVKESESIYKPGICPKHWCSDMSESMVF